MFGTAQTTVVVHINDVNEPPEFLNSHYTTVVSEGAGMGELLFSGIVAFDLDEVSYCIYYETISHSTGQMFTPMFIYTFVKKLTNGKVYS